jgi:hypothetical protein
MGGRCLDVAPVLISSALGWRALGSKASILPHEARSQPGGPLKAALDALRPRLAAEGVPEREELFFELSHPDRAGEKAMHTLR